MAAEESIALTETALKKLTVPQLKLMCKERRVVGYSKLAKDGIIQKLLGWQAASGLVLTTTTCPSPAGINDSLTSKSKLTGNETHATRAAENLHDNVMELEPACLNQIAKAGITAGSRSPPPTSSDETLLDIVNDCDTGSSKRSGTETRSFLTPKKPRLDTNLTITNNKRSQVGMLFTPENFGPKTQESVHAGVSKTANTSHQLRAGGMQSFVNPLTNRKFKVLKPFSQVDTMAKSSTHTLRPAGLIPTITASSKHVSGAKELLGQDPPSHLENLNFPPEQPVLLTAILFPPSVAQRKHMPTLSLILSGISYEDLKSCVLVSRAFRYAAYLSAFHQLSRRFQGKRLQDILLRHPNNMINMWPYLCLREREITTRKSIYERSFLSKALNGIAEADEQLWHCPNHEKQITVAIRFLMTKLFFLLSMGHCTDHYNPSGKSGRVVDAQEVVENEIWKITYCSLSSVQTFYVLEATCEVIGESEYSSDMPLAPQSLREDWLAYINAASARTDASQHNGLLEHLEWSNHEEYDKGISKVWLKRIETEREVGLTKQAIAMRYVFACVIGNSISGPWRRANEMAQDFDGRVSVQTVRNQQIKRLSLFLPMHHHVESVHFTSTNGRALHEALAVVQTPGREYFILRDNGMQVGCEEEGVGLIWMKTLGCSGNGCVETREA